MASVQNTKVCPTCQQPVPEGGAGCPRCEPKPQGPKVLLLAGGGVLILIATVAALTNPADEAFKGKAEKAMMHVLGRVDGCSAARKAELLKKNWMWEEADRTNWVLLSTYEVNPRSPSREAPVRFVGLLGGVWQLPRTGHEEAEKARGKEYREITESDMGNRFASRMSGLHKAEQYRGHVRRYRDHLARYPSTPDRRKIEDRIRELKLMTLKAADRQYPIGSYRAKMRMYAKYLETYPDAPKRVWVTNRIKELDKLRNGHNFKMRVTKAYAPGCAKKSVSLRIRVFDHKDRPLYESKKLWSYSENPGWKKKKPIPIHWRHNYKMVLIMEEYRKGQTNRTVVAGWVDPGEFPGRVRWAKTKAWAEIELVD